MSHILVCVCVAPHYSLCFLFGSQTHKNPSTWTWRSSAHFSGGNRIWDEALSGPGKDDNPMFRYDAEAAKVEDRNNAA